MIFKNTLLVAILTFCSTLLYGQYAYTGVKIGAGLAGQSWSQGVNTNIIITPNIDVFWESHDEGSLSKVFAQVGYHQRGSGIGFGINTFASYRFHNAVLELGGKRRATDGEKWDAYYLLALRAEYTLGNNLAERGNTNIFNLALEEFVNKFNYGVTIGGGFDYDFSENQVLFFELSFSPDLSSQYDQPFQIGPFENQFTGNSFFIQPQQVRNYTLELKVGYKWLQ